MADLSEAREFVEHLDSRLKETGVAPGGVGLSAAPKRGLHGEVDTKDQRIYLYYGDKTNIDLEQLKDSARHEIAHLIYRHPDERQLDTMSKVRDYVDNRGLWGHTDLQYPTAYQLGEVSPSNPWTNVSSTASIMKTPEIYDAKKKSAIDALGYMLTFMNRSAVDKGLQQEDLERGRYSMSGVTVPSIRSRIDQIEKHGLPQMQSDVISEALARETEDRDSRKFRKWGLMMRDINMPWDIIEILRPSSQSDATERYNNPYME